MVIQVHFTSRKKLTAMKREKPKQIRVFKGKHKAWNENHRNPSVETIRPTARQEK